MSVTDLDLAAKLSSKLAKVNTLYSANANSQLAQMKRGSSIFLNNSQRGYFNPNYAKNNEFLEKAGRFVGKTALNFAKDALLDSNGGLNLEKTLNAAGKLAEIAV